MFGYPHTTLPCYKVFALFLHLVVPFNFLCYLKTHVEIFLFHNAYQLVISSAVHYLTPILLSNVRLLHSYEQTLPYEAYPINRTPTGTRLRPRM